MKHCKVVLHSGCEWWHALAANNKKNIHICSLMAHVFIEGSETLLQMHLAARSVMLHEHKFKKILKEIFICFSHPE